MYDAIVIGGGPAGLQAALTLARGQRSALVVDGGVPRNARAHEVHNFVTRDGTPPAAFRAHAHAELARYGVAVREGRVGAVEGGPDAFVVRLDDGVVEARRVIVCTGMIDLLPELPGLRELWGATVFQCPFCHGHEVRGGRFGVWLTDPAGAHVVDLVHAWSADVIVFAGADLGPIDARVETTPVRALHARPDDPGGLRLGAVELADGRRIARDALLYRPPQVQTALVRSLGLALDPGGFVVLDRMGQTSRPGVFAAGDLANPMQSALGAAAQGQLAAAGVCFSLGRPSVAPSRRPA